MSSRSFLQTFFLIFHLRLTSRFFFFVSAPNKLSSQITKSLMTKHLSKQHVLIHKTSVVKTNKMFFYPGRCLHAMRSGKILAKKSKSHFYCHVPKIQSIVRKIVVHACMVIMNNKMHCLWYVACLRTLSNAFLFAAISNPYVINAG